MYVNKLGLSTDHYSQDDLDPDNLINSHGIGKAARKKKSMSRKGQKKGKGEKP